MVTKLHNKHNMVIGKYTNATEENIIINKVIKLLKQPTKGKMTSKFV